MNARGLALTDILFSTEGVKQSESRWDWMRSHPRFPCVLRREFYACGASTGVHHHVDFRALYVVRRGRGVHEINDEPFAITRGDIYFLGVGARHAYLDFQNLEIDALYFPPELWSADERTVLEAKRAFAEPEPPGMGRGAKRVRRRVEPRFRMRPEAWRRAELEIERLRALWCDARAGADLVLRGALFAFVWELANALEPEEEGATGESLPRLDLDAAIGEAVRLCDEEFAFAWSVELLAARTFLSPRHFGELFGRRTGQSPALYLRNVRLERAKTMLLESGVPVAEVARRTGWNDAVHFSRAFAKKFGVSPRGFRSRHK